MATLLEQIIARANERTDFLNDKLEVTIKKQQALDLQLVSATQGFEAACEEAGLDPVEASKAVLGLTREFAEIIPAPTAERTARIKAFVAELIDEDEENQDLETASEGLFNAAFEWEIGLTATVVAINEIVPAEEA